MHARYGITEDYVVKESASVLKGLLKAYPEFRATPFFLKLVRALPARDLASLVDGTTFIPPQCAHPFLLVRWPWAPRGTSLPPSAARSSQSRHGRRKRWTAHASPSVPLIQYSSAKPNIACIVTSLSANRRAPSHSSVLQASGAGDYVTNARRSSPPP